MGPVLRITEIKCRGTHVTCTHKINQSNKPATFLKSVIKTGLLYCQRLADVFEVAVKYTWEAAVFPYVYPLIVLYGNHGNVIE